MDYVICQLMKSHDPSTVHNMDETAITNAIGSTHQYVSLHKCPAANVGNVNTKLINDKSCPSLKILIILLVGRTFFSSVDIFLLN